MKTVESQFKIVAVSNNTNSFGLTGIIAVSRKGETFQFGYSNYINPIKANDEVLLSFPVKIHNGEFVMDGELPIMMNGNTIEIPEKLHSPPKEVLQELFPN